MISTNENDTAATIELAPIIDMVFLLLIFFLVATTFHRTEREMQIALPHAASAGPISSVKASGASVVPLTMIFPSASTLTMISRSAVEIGPDALASGSLICISRSVW